MRIGLNNVVTTAVLSVCPDQDWQRTPDLNLIWYTVKLLLNTAPQATASIHQDCSFSKVCARRRSFESQQELTG